MTDSDRLVEIKARRAAVRGLPWELDGDEIIDPAGQVIAEVMGRTNPPFISHAPADTAWLVGEVERLRGLLARLEWAGDRCPACGRRRNNDHGHRDRDRQHEPDCWLAAEVHRDPDD